MIKILKNFISILLLTVIPTVFIWIPFFYRVNKFWGIPLPQNGMATVVANYDGPLYIVVAKTLYDQTQIGQFSLDLPTEYYAAHFPLYPLLIRAFSTPLGYPYAMLFATIATSFLAIYFFTKLISDYVNKNEILWISLVFSILPARFLIVRSVGSAEPLFIASIIASLFYFKKQKYLLSGFWGTIAVLTKSPGILLFISYIVYFLLSKFRNTAFPKSIKWLTSDNLRKYLPLLLMPLGLFAVFCFYKIQLNNFYAYFDSGDNIHLFFPPFQIFNYSQPWVGTFWLEEIIFVYLFGLLALIKLIKSKETVFATFFTIFFSTLFFISHRDLIRYSLPLIPFVFLAFSDTIIKKEFKIAFLVLIIPIYLFSLSYISQNVMPIPNWGPFL